MAAPSLVWIIAYLRARRNHHLDPGGACHHASCHAVTCVLDACAACDMPVILVQLARPRVEIFAQKRHVKTGVFGVAGMQLQAGGVAVSANWKRSKDWGRRLAVRPPRSSWELFCSKSRSRGVKTRLGQAHVVRPGREKRKKKDAMFPANGKPFCTTFFLQDSVAPNPTSEILFPCMS